MWRRWCLAGGDPWDDGPESGCAPLPAHHLAGDDAAVIAHSARLILPFLGLQLTSVAHASNSQHCKPAWEVAPGRRRQTQYAVVAVVPVLTEVVAQIPNRVGARTSRRSVVIRDRVTNAIRRAVKAHGHFPSDRAAEKLVFLALRNVEAKWRNPPSFWHASRVELSIRFGDLFRLLE